MALTSTDAPSESVKPKTVRAAAVVAEAEAEVVAATTAEAVVAATVAMIVAAVEVAVIAVAVAAMSATGAVAVAAEAVATTAGVVAESAIAAFDLSKRNVFSLPGENMQLNLGSLFGVSSLFANPAKGVTFAQSMRSRSAPFT